MTQNSDTLAIQAVIDGVDHVAAEMEKEWGVGRLRLLVDDDMRERFDRQAALLNEAVFTNDAKAVRRHGEGMRKAWQALGKYASDCRFCRIDPFAWEVNGPDGVIAVVRTNPEAHAVVREGRAVEVWTLDEVARVIASHRDTIGEAKRVFPGAEVVDVRVKPIDREKGDDWL